MDSSDRQRVTGEQAFVLHRRAFRDTSQIVDIFSRNYGRLSLVARGIRSKKSRLRSALQAFTPLTVNWSIKGDLGNLLAAESQQAGAALQGDALLAGFYLNELILKLTYRFDPVPEIFDLYESALLHLGQGVGLQLGLRRFEFRLLALLGYAVQLRHDIASGDPITAEANYRLQVESGPYRVSDAEQSSQVYSGAVLQAIAAEQLDSPDVLRAAQRITRLALDERLEGQTLKTRKVLLEIKGK